MATADMATAADMGVAVVAAVAVVVCLDAKSITFHVWISIKK
jgi:hypothetical protein